jgi:hypothetical protein
MEPTRYPVVGTVHDCKSNSVPALAKEQWEVVLGCLPIGVAICNSSGLCIFRNARAIESNSDEGTLVALHLTLHVLSGVPPKHEY